MQRLLLHTTCCLLLLFSVSCGSLSSGGSAGGTGVAMGGPSLAERKAQIATEEKGDFYYGRRYFVERTRFWGYLRKPGQDYKTSQLVIMDESRKRNPDRLPEDGPTGAKWGYDHNYEYKITGGYTGAKVYDPNSNQILPEFQPSSFEAVNKKPGWIFTPSDRYNSKAFTLRP